MANKWTVFEPDKDEKLYEKFITRYWNWLLNEEKVVDEPINGEEDDEVFFMRPGYDYANRWETNPDGAGIARKNLPINRVGGVNHSYKAGKNIFLPVIDSCVCDFEKDASGMPLTQGLINEILEKENNDVLKKIQYGRVRSMIRCIDKGEPYEDLVKDLGNYIFPKEKNAIHPFKLSIPENSKLAESLEFEFPKPRKDVMASAQGLYLIFRINESGRFQIRSAAEGLRGFTANMNYQIQIN